MKPPIGMDSYRNEQRGGWIGLLTRTGLALVCALLLFAGLQQVISRASASSVDSNRKTTRAAAPESPEAETEWNDFFPSGWVSETPFDAGITASNPDGFELQNALYQVSTDGGVTWSGWLTDDLTIASPVSTSLKLTVTGLTTPDSPPANLNGNQIYFRVERKQAGWVDSGKYSITVDTEAPFAPFDMISTPDTWTNINSFSESWEYQPGPSAVVGAYYRLNTLPSFPTDGTFVTTTNAISDIQVPAEGTHNLIVWLVDQAGNVDHRRRGFGDPFKLDLTAPTVSAEPDQPPTGSGWYTNPVTVTFDPSDPPGDPSQSSGVASWGWQLDQITTSSALSTVIVSDLDHEIIITATDNAGNTMAPATSRIRIDGVAPVLTYTVSHQPGITGWYSTPLTISFHLTDQLSQPDQVTWQLDDQPPVTSPEAFVSGNGHHTMQAFGKDKAGNRSLPVEIDFSIDTIPPTTTVVITPAMASTGYFTAPVSGHLEAVDAPPGAPPDFGSGVQATWLRINGGNWAPAEPFQFDDDGSFLLEYQSMDFATNLEEIHQFTIALDATPPGSPIHFTFEPTGWASENSFVMTWQNPADSSGIAGAFVHLGDPPGPGEGEFFENTTVIDSYSVPAEGEWPLWVWLVDAAGNASPPTGMGVLRFDGTPPLVTLDFNGPLGSHGWYVGTIDATIAIADTGSGPSFLRYRTNGNPWQQTSELQVSLAIDQPGNNLLTYEGQDLAGNSSGPYTETFQLDADPPGPPIAPQIVPDTWSSSNQFTVTWSNPPDTSGVALLHASFDPPSDPQGSFSVPAGDQTTSLQAPGQGAYDLYMWLEDRAGNVDFEQAVLLEEGLRFDQTPPVTTVSFDAEPSDDGWFREEVIVSLQASDDHAGVRTTFWELNGQAPVASNSLSIQEEGVHTLAVYSIDHAGNIEQPTEHIVKIDTRAPLASLYPLAKYSASRGEQPRIHVAWDGNDGEPVSGVEVSGLDRYEVQVREGAAGQWQTWITTSLKSLPYDQGERGKVYAFRVRANDRAGNVSQWQDAGGENRTLLDPVNNGDFQNYSWAGWTVRQEILLDPLQETDLFPGETVAAMRLGSVQWMACALAGYPMLPTPRCGDSWSSLAQTISVPEQEDVPEPVLEFWYRIQTYDQISTTNTIWASRLCTPSNPADPEDSWFWWVDSFDVSAESSDTGEVDILLRDGNPEEQITDDDPNPPILFRDMGWQMGSIDMSPYAGQTVTLEFASHNRLDNRFNTWTDVQGIRLRGEQHQLFMPLTPQNAGLPPDEPVVCYPLGPPDPDLQDQPMTLMPQPANRTPAERIR
ncbi:MAG: hypothetical protein U9R25_14150 [Chloroflexota bacterium]|nr:hypothetical protein [Chloroflexota bacterium]